MPAQHADGDPDIPLRLFQPDPGAHVTRPLLNLRQSAELSVRRGAGVGLAHASGDVARGLLVEMRAHFVGHIGVEFLATKQGMESE